VNSLGLDDTQSGRLRIFGNAIAGDVAINTDDSVQPSRQTRDFDHDLSYTTQITRNKY